MSERADCSQLELFSSQPKIYGRTNSSLEGGFVFRHVKEHERIILIIVGILITGLVAFSLGVEKGKGFAGNIDFAPVTVKSEDASIVPEVPLRPKAEKRETIAPRLSEDTLQYTIQLASYQNNSSAKKEAETLKKKGLLPLVSSKGKYTVLCVGNFADKRNALALLPELKKRYSDCFIRRL